MTYCRDSRSRHRRTEAALRCVRVAADPVQQDFLGDPWRAQETDAKTRPRGVNTGESNARTLLRPDGARRRIGRLRAYMLSSGRGTRRPVPFSHPQPSNCGNCRAETRDQNQLGPKYPACRGFRSATESYRGIPVLIERWTVENLGMSANDNIPAGLRVLAR